MVIQTSIRGNKEEGIPNQDHIAFFENEDLLIAAVCDGLGSSKHSLVGATIACQVVIDELQNVYVFHQLQQLGTSIKNRWEKEINRIADSLNDYRTTCSFVGVFKKEKKIVAGQLGDVLISLRIDGLFRYLQSNNKDFSNETECLGSGRKEKFSLVVYEFSHSFDFLIATDGIADELQPEKIESFHNYLKEKFQNIEISLRNDVLKNEIEEFINEKNNDDKSLIFILSTRNK
jgi:serine/threonine protein phosphatase PrpC